MNRKNFILLTITLSLLGVLIHGVYKYISEGAILGGTIFASAIIISYLINHMTWGDPNGVSEESKDEMGQQIKYKSFKIAYFALICLIFFILILSEGFAFLLLDEIKNLPLFIALCSSFFIYPIVEFVVAKQYK
ncbi:MULTISPECIES: hypothetical protein [Bacillus]|uniref:Group-specific protein n=1 Tax=Bacillus wiedmannii TaxID=1890302 RepID=A0A2B6KV70_9BACI|nr:MULTISPECIES: hypothetical protein [Bacillus]MDF9666250.1 hypothetical protein [Bacillus wiedmannii]MDI6507718.1 hypothetical protein [Bacillus wiedmannii]MDI6513179.1 hypothetical protein [Bacillus wiedmannii]PFZ25456.1 hypothetical protein COL51_17695 [Bacillus wiedmannii]PGC19928.1 hypothetical protein COM08_07915 [Bacillus wiedmannii]